MNPGVIGRYRTAAISPLARDYFRFSDGMFKNQRPDLPNTYTVSPNGGDFNTLNEAFTFLHTLTTRIEPLCLRLDAGIFPVTNTLSVDFSFPLSVRCSGTNVTKINASTGLLNKPMFHIHSEFDIHRAKLDGSTLTNWILSDDAKFFDMVEEGVYSEFFDIILTGGARGICCTTPVEIFVSNFKMLNMRQVGIGFDSDVIGGKFDISNGDFVNCGFGINLFNGEGVDVNLADLSFENEAGQTGINYVGADFEYSKLIIKGCDHNDIGEFTSGFDFTVSRDADIELINCISTQYRNAHPKANFILTNRTDTTTVGTSWVKLNFVVDSSFGQKFEYNETTNKLTYLSSHSADAWITVSGSVKLGAVSTFALGIAKNGDTGAIYKGLTTRSIATNQPFITLLDTQIMNLQKDDYLEIYGLCGNANKTLTVLDMSMQSDAS